MGEDHVLNINLHIKLLILLIFTDIQGVKVCLFHEGNNVSSMLSWLIYCALAL